MTGDDVLAETRRYGDAIAIRPAGERDLGSIIALLVDDPLGKTRERVEDPIPQDYVDALRAMAAQGGNVYLVAERDGAVIGCVQVTFIAGISRGGMMRANVEGVRIASSARGLGLGKAMMRDVIERARDAGCGLIQLTTDTRREDARRFYEGLGFTASHTGMKLNLD
ncbi:MAG: GNAT family N-acetyltransferase [Alphaproteobacteria bacterium]|nr:GNAT family N-acetyltransferase [Alphaproteobacteria bacterium]